MKTEKITIIVVNLLFAGISFACLAHAFGYCAAFGFLTLASYIKPKTNKD